MLIVAIILAARRGNNHMNNKYDAKYVFYYLLSLEALVFTAFSVGMVIFSIINKTIPDALNNYYGDVDGALKFAISALFIAAPIFYFVSSLITKGLRKGELEKESALRRWLTYFILLVSSLIILGVFISVINSFLSGELTSRFVLKALSVFVLSALPFAYYYYDIKRPNPEEPNKIVKIFFFGTMALVLIAFIAAWFFVESPKTARARLLDQKLMQNISNIEGTINTYYDRYKKLPENLELLAGDSTLYFEKKSLLDPETGAKIVYEIKSGRDYALCATFRLSTIKDDKTIDNSYVNGSIGREHEAGYQCLKSSVSVDIKDAEVRDAAVKAEAIKAQPVKK